MENKPIENKRLTKILFISGFGMLIVFILIRLAFKSTQDRVTDMPSVGELEYNPAKIREKSKSEQFEEQKIQAQRKEMGYDENNYVVPDFNDLTKKNEIKVEAVPDNDENPYKAVSAHYSAKQPVIVQQRNSDQRSEVPGSKLNYRSQYFASKTEQNITDEAIQEEKQTAPAKNPFGTVSSIASGQNSQLNTSTFYKAEIYGDQKIENSGMVIIRNTEALQCGSVTIPKNSILYGQASFNGNRVFIKINRAKTPQSEFMVAFSILDNDRLEGIYFKAPIDETVDKTKEDANIQVPGKYGSVISSAAQTITRSAKEMMKKSVTLNLEEGYQLFIVPFKQN